MELKLLEIRDSGTCIVAGYARLSPDGLRDVAMLARCGYGDNIPTQESYVLLMKLDGAELELQYDPYVWGSRTMFRAHEYLLEHPEFDKPLLDIGHVLGAYDYEKKSEFPE